MYSIMILRDQENEDTVISRELRREEGEEVLGHLQNLMARNANHSLAHRNENEEVLRVEWRFSAPFEMT